MAVSFIINLVPVSPGPVPAAITVVSQPAPVLPLDFFRQILGYHPYHFWGLANADVPVNSQCNTIVTEYAYQGENAAGRYEIRQALINAQEKLRAFLQYPIAPQYLEETVTYPAYLDQRLFRDYPVAPSGGWVSVQLPDGYIQSIGVESLSLVGTAALTFSDRYGTGTNDTFTLSIATSETDVSKIAVYFAAADRLDSSAVGAQWRIEPVDISISGGIATITGRAWLLVKPSLYQKFTRVSALNPDTVANFVTTLEVYVRTTEPDGNTVDTSQGAFVWESWPGECCSTQTDPAGVARSIARVGIRNAAAGIVIPGEAIYNATDDAWYASAPPWSGICRPPQQVTVRYLAGVPLEANGQVNARFARAVAYLAMAELAERICACDTANRTLYRYQLPLNQTGANQETFAVTREQLNNPLGNRYGHWAAWNEIKTLRLVRGISVG